MKLSPNPCSLLTVACSALFVAPAFAQPSGATFNNLTVGPTAVMNGTSATYDLLSSGGETIGNVTIDYGDLVRFDQASSSQASGGYLQFMAEDLGGFGPGSASVNWTIDIQITAAGWYLDGYSMFSERSVLANPVWSDLTFDGEASIYDGVTTVSGGFFPDYATGDLLISGNDLVSGNGTTASGWTVGSPWAVNFNLDESVTTSASISFGYSTHKSGSYTVQNEVLDLSFSAVQIPEPTSMALLGIFAASSMIRRRR